MNNQETARVLSLVLGGEQSQINQIFGLKAEDILSVDVQATPYQLSNSKVKVRTVNQGVREFNYNRQSLAEAISVVLGTEVLNAAQTGSSVATALTAAGLTVDETDIDVTALGSTAVKIAASTTNVRYYGSINIQVTGEETPTVEVPGGDNDGSDDTDNGGESPDPETPAPEESNPTAPPSVSLAVTLPEPLLVTISGSTETLAITDLYGEFADNVDVVPDTNTINLAFSGNFIGTPEQQGSVTLPIYLGDRAFFDYVESLGNDNVVARITIDEQVVDMTAAQLLTPTAIELKQLFIPIALHTTVREGNMSLQLSNDGFVTSGPLYTVNYTNDLVYPE